MRNCLLAFLFLLKINSCCAQEQSTTTTKYDPLLVVVLMVKNEEMFITKTLQPFLDVGIDSYLVLDTGSDDNTILVTEKLFEKYNIKHGYIFKQQFVDFATSRNYALECAESNFPNAKFLFMIDAEWYVQNVDLLLQICADNVDDKIDSFIIRICHQNNEYYVRRIFKKNKKIRFVEPIHEYAIVNSPQELPNEIYILFDFTQCGVEKSRIRWKKDIDVLLKEYEKRPQDLRILFYLGQTYSDLQDYQNAIFWYEKRLQAGGWIEEKLLASYRIAQIYDFLNNWPMACSYYIQAYNLNPDRAESLVAIAKHYLNIKDYNSSYFFAKKACEKPYPKNAVVVDRFIYLYERFDILSYLAWQLHEYEFGLQILKKALQENPNDNFFIKNLKVFESAINKSV